MYIRLSVNAKGGILLEKTYNVIQYCLISQCYLFSQ